MGLFVCSTPIYRKEENIMQKADIKDVARLLGIAIENNKAICPFHTDHNPSLHFFPESNSFHCFGCQAHGNVYELIKKVKQIDFNSACNWLKKQNLKVTNNYNHNQDRKTKNVRRPPKKLVCPTAADSAIYNTLYDKLELDSKAEKYLKSRGFKDWIIAEYRFRSINNHKKIFKALKSIYTMEKLEHAGLIGNKGDKPYFIFYQPALLVFFMHDEFYYIQARNYSNRPKTTNLLRLSKPLFNTKVIEKSDKIWIAEGVFDALALTQLDFAAVALCGTTLNQHYADYFTDKDVVLYLDQDEAGQKARKRLQRQLSGVVNRITYIKHSDNLGSDPNDNLML